MTLLTRNENQAININPGLTGQIDNQEPSIREDFLFNQQQNEPQRVPNEQSHRHRSRL